MPPSSATTAAATSTAGPAAATAPSAPSAPAAGRAAPTIGRVRFEPEVGRFPPGKIPDRNKPGEVRWRRFPNHCGGSASVHPDDTAGYIANGIFFDDGRRARVTYVEREAFVDVLHFYFVTVTE